MISDSSSASCTATTEASPAEVLTFTAPAAPVVKKWQAGPTLGSRMAKAFNQALNAAAYAAKETVELSGIHGEPETQSRMGYVVMFGGHTHPEYYPRLAAIGQTHAWTVSADNYKTIIGDLCILSSWLKANATIVDKRITRAEHDRIEQERAAARAKQDAEIAAQKDAKEAEMSEARAKYPWAKRDGSHQANGAANLRTLLAQAFPGVAFRIRSDSYSMGSSIVVQWVNGPTVSAVSAISDQFQDSDFDGMQDMSIDRESGEGFRAWMGYAKHVNEDRTITPDLRAAVHSALTSNRTVSDWEARDTIDRETNALLAKTDIPLGATFSALVWLDDVGHVIKFDVPTALTSSAPVVSSVTGITVSENDEKDGVELRFPGKPSPDVIASLKAHGFRWAFGSRCWYHKRTPAHIAFARSLANAASEGGAS